MTTDPGTRPQPKKASRTRSFGAGNRENHDASGFYGRELVPAEVTAGAELADAPEVDRIWAHSGEAMDELPDNSVALMMTSPPYHVGKDYDTDTSFGDYLSLLGRVFTETHRVLEPGGRAVVNVANLGRKPYISLSSRIVLMMEEIGFLMRGEVIWRKGKAASGSTAWGSWMSATNPVLRDVHEYCLVFNKGRFDRVRRGRSTIEKQDFLDATLSVWDLHPESANRVGHPAPFPVTLPRRFIELFTYEGDLVLDPFIGSGTTAVAAVETGRHYAGYETNTDYARIAEERIAQAIAE
ncbi:MAG: site-specific DNA-methyltransferase [Actinomycetota bacterium]|nr:site-specific DNA-methyltransferase [Actinomycetota bacterium]